MDFFELFMFILYKDSNIIKIVNIFNLMQLTHVKVTFKKTNVILLLQ